MIRYIAVTSKEDWIIKNDDCICIYGKKPDVPYMKIDIKIIDKCKLHDFERDNPIKSFFKRLFKWTG